MFPSSFFAAILAFWSSFHLFHNFVLSSNTFGVWWSHLLQNCNICITLFQVRWFTKRWNRYFIHAGKYWNLTFWFNCGVFFAFFAMIISVGILTHTLIRSLQDLPIFAKQQHLESQQVLSVIVPGVNLPIHDFAYLILSVLLSGILHELGHAIAACREGVQVNGFGIFFFVIYPGAYVDLNSEDLSKASPNKQLRIYCAGVWHNFIICLFVCVLIFSLPILISPLYMTTGDGVIVTNQMHNSPLLGSKGLHTGDIVNTIGYCSVADMQSWHHCINHTLVSPQTGSCVPLRNVKEMDVLNGSWHIDEADASKNEHFDCCGEKAPLSHLCYMYNDMQQSFACLPGRVMMSYRDCLNNQDCHKGSEIETRETCITPHIVDHASRFIRIVVNRGSSKHHVLYLGDPTDLTRYVFVSEYRPRLSVLSLRFPAILLKFLQYMFSMSGALALLNIVPCYALDGQWAFKAFIDYFWTKGDPKLKDRICLVVLTMGTLLVAGNVIFGLYSIMSR